MSVLYHCGECFWQAPMMKLGTQNAYTDIVQGTKRIEI